MFDVRAISNDDASDCMAILNDIIATGGSTAHEDPFEIDAFRIKYIDGPAVGNVAIFDGRIVGFQVAFETKPGVFSIASFTDRQRPVPGAGRALFARTQSDCRNLNGETIHAVITSDNAGGLAYYAKMGFEPFEIRPKDFTRADGSVVDRVIKQFRL